MPSSEGTSDRGRQQDARGAGKRAGVARARRSERRRKCPSARTSGVCRSSLSTRRVSGASSTTGLAISSWRRPSATRLAE